MFDPRRWGVVVAFAVAMAWVEAAVVLYLRILLDRIEPYQANPLPAGPGIGGAELVREAATLIMLATVGALAGRTGRSRFGYACIAFGVWDIFYYVFLWALTGWPRSLLDWDILFLLPLPWWGPVLAPVSIAVLLLAGGTLLTGHDAPDRDLWPRRASLIAAAAGTLLALLVFMQDSLALLPQGETAIRQALPTAFPWSTFGLALVLMAVPVVDLGRQLWMPGRGAIERFRAPAAQTRSSPV